MGKMIWAISHAIPRKKSYGPYDMKGVQNAADNIML